MKGKWERDIGNHVRLRLRSRKGTLFQMEISKLAAAPNPRWYVLGDLGGLVQYGIDPQERPMIQGNIDAAEALPEHRTTVYSMRDGERKEFVVDSVHTSWKSYYRNIADALNHGTELAVKPEEARNAMAVMDASMESSRSGLPLKPQMIPFDYACFSTKKPVSSTEETGFAPYRWPFPKARNNPIAAP